MVISTTSDSESAAIIFTNIPLSFSLISQIIVTGTFLSPGIKRGQPWPTFFQSYRSWHPWPLDKVGKMVLGQATPAPGPRDSCQPTAQACNRRLGQGCEKGGTRPGGSSSIVGQAAQRAARTLPLAQLTHGPSSHIPLPPGCLTHEETSPGLQGRAPLPGSAFLRGTGASISYCLGNLSAHLTELE